MVYMGKPMREIKGSDSEGGLGVRCIKGETYIMSSLL